MGGPLKFSCMNNEGKEEKERRKKRREGRAPPNYNS